MSATGVALGRRTPLLHRSLPKSSDWTCFSCQQARSVARFSTSTRATQSQYNAPFRTRLRAALRNTKVQWKTIPVGLGIGFIGAVQLYRVRERQKRKQQEEDASDPKEAHDGDVESRERPRQRKRIRPSGPW